MTKAMELEMNELETVNGGTFTPNDFDERIYNQAGLRTDYNFWAKDEFFAKDKNGKEVSITYNQANQAVRMWQSTGVQPTYEEIAKYVRD